MRNYKELLLVLGFMFFSINAYAQNGLSVERFALYVASNDGGYGREVLKYAGSDAEKISLAMSELGGIKKSNSTVIIDPTVDELDKALTNVSKKIVNKSGKSKRTEFIFYYSGHSDERALMLGNERYTYGNLKEAISDVPSDVHVVLLDSCFSGNFIRAKGGSKQKSFLVDDSSIVQGHAYLSSSSESEASQESDEIESSFFTHSLVSGLRGAADTSGDNKVSLNELYHYAFNETLQSTEQTGSGPQHPSYNITMVGSGDLILTDIAESESVLVLDTDTKGRYFIRTLDGKLVSEIKKEKGNKLSLALPSGYYSVTIIDDNTTNMANVNLEKGKSCILQNKNLIPIKVTKNRNRGGSDTQDSESKILEGPESLDDIDDFVDDVLEYALHEARREFHKIKDSKSKEQYYYDDDYNYEDDVPREQFDDLVFLPIEIGIMSGVTSIPNLNYCVSLNAFMGITKSIKGCQLAGFMSIAKGEVRGIQMAGFMNVTEKDQNGTQMAGFMNVVRGDFKGTQMAGFMNVVDKDVKGCQMAGFMNTAGDGQNGLQMSGFGNVSKGKGKGSQISSFINIAGDFNGFQLGLINIANSNDGVSLGLINIIKDGINSPSVYLEGDQNIYFQYQNGTRGLYSTILTGTGKDYDVDYMINGVGFGSRIGKGFLSLDIELLYKIIWDFSKASQIAETAFIQNVFNNPYCLKDPNWETIFYDLSNHSSIFNSMPSVRFTLNASFGKHFTCFVSLEGNIGISGWNDNAFTYWTHEKSYDAQLGSTLINVYPSLTFGIKF